jgi:hypothetical protein
MVALYKLQHDKFPVLFDSLGEATTTKIYYGSQDWDKLKNLILSGLPFKIATADLSEALTVERPIEYFSNGDIYTFKVYLNYDKEYSVGGNNFKCQTKAGPWCILTINN